MSEEIKSSTNDAAEVAESFGKALDQFEQVQKPTLGKETNLQGNTIAHKIVASFLEGVTDFSAAGKKDMENIHTVAKEFERLDDDLKYGIPKIPGAKSAVEK